MRLLTGCIFSHIIHESRISIFIRPWSLPHPSLLQVITITATPFPGIVQIEHGQHLALAHLHQQIVETCKNRIIIHSRSLLQSRFHLSLYSSLAIRSYKNTKVVYTHRLHLVKFLAKTFTITTLSLRTENGTIPEIGPYIIIRFTITDKMSVLHFHKVRLSRNVASSS